jgi:lysyl endopeptidase
MAIHEKQRLSTDCARIGQGFRDGERRSSVDIGPYISENRNRAGGLWTAMVAGDELVVELHLLGGRESDIEITAVSHGYRSFGNGYATPKADRDRLPCQVNVVCPEGDRFRDQIRSTVIFEIRNTSGDIFNCTGTLLNNTAEDDTPYLLTASHCVEDPPTLRAYFNFQAPACGDTTGGRTDQSISGATLVANWGVAGGSVTPREAESLQTPGGRAVVSARDRRADRRSRGIHLRRPL